MPTFTKQRKKYIKKEENKHSISWQNVFLIVYIFRWGNFRPENEKRQKKLNKKKIKGERAKICIHVLFIVVPTLI